MFFGSLPACLLSFWNTRVHGLLLLRLVPQSIDILQHCLRLSSVSEGTGFDLCYAVDLLGPWNLYLLLHGLEK